MVESSLEEPSQFAAEGRILSVQEPDVFQRRIAALVLTFLSVASLDLVVGSLITHRLRVWFPTWLNPHWDTDPASRVIYSQSYIAGICLIPVLLRAIDREFLLERPRWMRIAWWGGGLAVFALICAWKGELMVRHHKAQEAVGWVAATGLLWLVVGAAQRLSGWSAAVSRTRLLRGATRALAGFFLVMAVLDPLIQLGGHRLRWTWGLVIEVAFFIPAGIASLLFARQLGEQHA